jgi:hypothetical protein
LNLEIARMAKEFGMEDKVQETRLLGEMIKLRSSYSAR